MITYIGMLIYISFAGWVIVKLTFGNPATIDNSNQIKIPTTILGILALIGAVLAWYLSYLDMTGLDWKRSLAAFIFIAVPSIVTYSSYKYYKK